MKTQTQSAKVSKVNNGKATKVIKATQSKASETKKVSDYTIKVLNTNKALKEEAFKLGYCIKQLDNIILPKEFKSYLNTMKKDSSIYKLAENNVRRSKVGKFTAFYLLQYLYKVTK
jgi:hypothetical protein